MGFFQGRDHHESIHYHRLFEPNVIAATAQAEAAVIVIIIDDHKETIGRDH
jgi:hypothetical protein